MRLLCHRGRWRLSEERNSLDALMRAIRSGHGVETDVRDCDGELVIAHDPPLKRMAVNLDTFLAAYAGGSHKACLALNIKSDGLHDRLTAMLGFYGIENYFVFDMSLPDTLGYMGRGVPFAARISEYETGVGLLEKASYVWLDIFHSEWYRPQVLANLLGDGKKVAIVSPDLHGRSHLALWAALKAFEESGDVYLCTDLVDEALEFFRVQQD